MSYMMPVCFDRWKSWHACLTGESVCVDHAHGNAILSREQSCACWQTERARGSSGGKWHVRGGKGCWATREAIDACYGARGKV